MKTQRLINPNDRTVTVIQSRHHTSLELIIEYADQMAAGVQFDPCSGIETSEGEIYIWDGKHRLESAIRNGSMLLVELEPGTKEEAIWKACSANKKHGLKRSNADIQKAVQDALQLHPEKSDRDIGLWVGCDHKTVGKYRKELAVSGDIPQMHTRTVKRGDQEYQMDMPIKTEPVEKPDVNQPVRHLTGFVPPDVQSSTQKRLSLKPNEDKPRMTIENLKPRIKMFLQQEFPSFPEALAALEELSSSFMLQEPYRSLMSRLGDFIRIQYRDNKDCSIRRGCQAALEDWNALADFREQIQAASEDVLDEEPEPEQEEEDEHRKGHADAIIEGDKEICTFCHSVHTIDNHLYKTSNGLTVCQDCIAKEAAKFQLYSRDRDRIIKAGLRLYSCTKVYCTPKKFRIREYTNTNGQGGTWKDFEKFESLTAMKDRLKALEQEENIIFDGRL